MEKRNITKKIGNIWSHYSYIVVMLVIMVVYAITISANGNSFRWSHISAILSSQNTCIIGTMAIGMALVVITGQIDLSIGSSLVFTTSACIVAFNMTNSVLVMILTALIVGGLLGLINGTLVGLAKMPPFIATMGTMLIYRSLSLSIVRSMDTSISGSTSSQFAMLRTNSKYDFLRFKFGTGKLGFGNFAIPYITLVFLIMVVLFILITKKTKYGKSIYAVGSNEKSAHLSGINTTFVKVSVFVVTGLLVGVASVLQACKLGNVTPASSGKSYEMYAIAAIVLGGISMAGGKGNLLGIIFGALSYTTVNFIIVSIPSLSVDIQDTFQGLVLIVVILIQTLSPIIKESVQTAKRRRLAAEENK